MCIYDIIMCIYDIIIKSQNLNLKHCGSNRLYILINGKSKISSLLNFLLIIHDHIHVDYNMKNTHAHDKPKTLPNICFKTNDNRKIIQLINREIYFGEDKVWESF